MGIIGVIKWLIGPINLLTKYGTAEEAELERQAQGLAEKAWCFRVARLPRA